MTSTTTPTPSCSRHHELDAADAAVTLPPPRGPELDADAITLPLP